MHTCPRDVERKVTQDPGVRVDYPDIRVLTTCLTFLTRLSHFADIYLLFTDLSVQHNNTNTNKIQRKEESNNLINEMKCF